MLFLWFLEGLLGGKVMAAHWIIMKPLFRVPNTTYMSIACMVMLWGRVHTLFACNLAYLNSMLKECDWNSFQWQIWKHYHLSELVSRLYPLAIFLKCSKWCRNFVWIPHYTNVFHSLRFFRVLSPSKFKSHPYLQFFFLNISFNYQV